MSLFVGVAAALIGSAAFGQSTYLRIHSREVREMTPATSGTVAPVQNGPLAATASVCSEDEMAWHSQAVPGGGTLQPYAFAFPANIAGPNRIAYGALVQGSPRNQGVFLGTGGAVQPIAIGCGMGGGSGDPGTGVGDPSPIGGRFTGFFIGTTPFAPATNTSGDVLFVADVNGGSAPRGLFLYRASTGTIVKVAAVGDVSPTGATLTEIGPGSINNNGVVVFIASRTSSSDNELLRWTNGVLTKIAAVGDAAPSGGNYLYVAGEYFGFADGTNIPTGPVPDINDSGAVAFRGYTNGGVSGVVFVPPGGPAQWYVRDGDATPHGGTYGGIWGPVLNNANQVAFYSDCIGAQSGWFVGKPGSWRKALVFFDTIDTGGCVGLAVSRNPMQPLDEDGDVTMWCDEDLGGPTKSWLVCSKANGTLVRVAAQGDSTALGGFVGGMDAWPSMRADQCTLSCGTPGAPGIVSAYFLDTLCAPVMAYCTPGTTVHGCLATMSGTGTPSITASSGFTIAASNVEGQKSGILFYGINGQLIQPWGTGSTSYLCVKTPTQRTGVQTSGGTTNLCNGALSLDFNAFRAANPTALGQPMFSGQTIDAQAWFRDPGSVKNTSLSDALEFTMTP